MNFYLVCSDYLSSTCSDCSLGSGSKPVSVALRPCGMGGRTGWASDPGRPGEATVGDTCSGAEREDSGLTPDSIGSAGRKVNYHAVRVNNNKPNII